MDFANIKKQQINSPPLIGIYGGPGIGKTTFSLGAKALDRYEVGLDNHLLIDIDHKSADRIKCKRASEGLEKPIDTIDDIKSIFKSLAIQNHNYEWIVFDNLSSLEELFVQEICRVNGVSAIEKVEYGKGFELAKEPWFNFFDCIKHLQAERNIGVILIAHTKIENMKDPMTETYSKHFLQLDKRAKAIVMDRIELVGFAHTKSFTKEVDAGFGKKKTEVVGKSQRVLTFAPDIEGFESKDRFNLPEEIPLDWSIFVSELNKSLNKNNEVVKNKTKEKK